MKNPYKVSAISLLLTIIFAIISIVFMAYWVIAYKNIYPIYFILLVNVILSVLFYNGLMSLGKKYSSNLLKAGSMLRVVIMILFFVILTSVIALNMTKINNFIVTTFDSFKEEMNYQTSSYESSATIDSQTTTTINEENATPDVANVDNIDTELENELDSTFNSENFNHIIKQYSVWTVVIFIIFLILSFLPELLIGFGLLEAGKHNLQNGQTSGIFALIYSFGGIIQMSLVFASMMLLFNSSFMAAFLAGIFNNIIGLVVSIASIVYFIFILIVLFKESSKVSN